MAFGRRNRRPSLLGTAARTAVIAGTATAASNAVNAKAANQNAAAAPLAAAAVPEDDLLTRLERLAALHASGALSDSEFAAVKATLIP